MKWFYLTIAIVGEMIATSFLKESSGFTKIVPSIITVVGYCFTFYFLSLALKQIPIGVAYAVWAGVGILLVTLVGYFRFKQTLDAAAITGIVLIVVGVFVMFLFSKTMSN